MSSPGIYAKPGEWVSCEAGHRVFQIVDLLCYGDKIDIPNQTTAWQQDQPPLGTPLGNVACRVADCWARYVDRSHPGVFHFEEGGWRRRPLVGGTK